MFKPWPKIPRLSKEKFSITEKIDGTNACIVIDHLDPKSVNTPPYSLARVGNVNIAAQSRTRFLSPTNDNFGFARWVVENADALSELSEGYHFGEWWGQGIQRGYGMPEKVFSLFNPFIISSITRNVPVLADDISFEMLPTIIEDCRRLLLTKGSLANPGYDKPEGLIVHAKLSDVRFKIVFP
jgi:hypothetical protein